MTNFKILLPVFFLLILITFFSLSIPFFWDSTFFSALSVHFNENGINGFIAPLSTDTGGFPLYSIYLTTIWKCFGKSLAISHIAILPFMIGVAFEYLKLAKRYLNNTTIKYAILLLLIEPVFITQSILMGYDILIAYFFLLCLNALNNKMNILFSIGLAFLCLISVRGTILAFAFFVIELLMNRKLDFKWLKNYLPAISIIITWTIYHKLQTGWYIFSPVREDNSEQFTGITMMSRQFLYALWKNIDMGRITLWGIFIVFGYYISKRNNTPLLKELSRNIFIPLLTLTLVMILIKNPIGHKYFLTVFLLLNISVCYLLEHVKKKIKITLYSLIVISLIGGNFITYPQRYGNAWDSSLKILPFFKVEKEMNNYITINQIKCNNVGTQFPLTNDLRYSHLIDSSYYYTDIENNPTNTFQYFLYSNIINTNRMDEIEEIKKSWTVEKELKKEGIIITLYKNPKFLPLYFFQKSIPISTKY